MIEMIACILAGFLGHKLEKPTCQWFQDADQNRLVRYVEGGVIVQTAATALFMSSMPRRQALLASGLLALTWIGVGAGTVLGYIADGLTGAQK